MAGTASAPASVAIIKVRFINSSPYGYCRNGWKRGAREYKTAPHPIERDNAALRSGNSSRIPRAMQGTVCRCMKNCARSTRVLYTEDENGTSHAFVTAVSRMSQEIDHETDHESDREADAARASATYSYRPSLLGAPWTFVCNANGIDWTAGAKSGRVPYGKVRRLRMSYRPMSMQSHRFATELWAQDGTRLTIVSTSWKSMVEQERQDRPYAAFIRELHRNIAAAGAPVRCEKGKTPWLYWPGFVTFLGVAFGLAVLIVRALQAHALTGAAFIAGFLALFLWQGGNFFRRNRPGLYRPDAPPEELLPRG